MSRRHCADAVEGPAAQQAVELGLARRGVPGGAVALLGRRDGGVLGVEVVGSSRGVVGALVVVCAAERGIVEAVDDVCDVLALLGMAAWVVVWVGVAAAVRVQGLASRTEAVRVRGWNV